MEIPLGPKEKQLLEHNRVALRVNIPRRIVRVQDEDLNQNGCPRRLY